jgi:crotonobetainyl-CoA:carnitine CoA-transferase CaiB-like acyl-CoA transferase
LLNTATFTNSETLLRTPDGTLATYPRLNHDQTGLDHGYRMYDVADGSVAIVALDERRRVALRNVARVDTDEQVADALRERESAELLAALEAAEVPAERVLERQYAQVFDDDENRRTGVVVSYRQAEWGQMEQFGAYWHLGEAKLRLDRPCPAVGEHSREILGEIGFSNEEITRLAGAGLVSGQGLKREQS